MQEDKELETLLQIEAPPSGAPAAEVIPPEIIPSPQQAEGLVKIEDWYANWHLHRRSNFCAGLAGPQQVFYLAGYAGTGKTTFAKSVLKILQKILHRRPRIEVATFTGKAALVLRTKGWPGSRTIHNLIYKLDGEDDDGNPTWILNKESYLYDADLLLVDEVSMVGQEMGADLLKFNRPILVLGDPGQLPPIDGTGFFTSRTPDHFLTEIHRQALDSPIIKWATAVRTGKGLGGRPMRDGDCEVLKRAFVPKGQVQPLHLYSTYGLTADQTICGLNATRHTFNAKLRQLRFPGSPAGQPIVGDKLICLKNDHEVGLLNGGMWEVISEPKLFIDSWEMRVKSLDLEDFSVDIKVPAKFFLGQGSTLTKEELFEKDQFDFGYAITCHKSQGSQWDRVFIYNENYVFRDNAARWLYTAITRAAKSVVIVL